MNLVRITQIFAPALEAIMLASACGEGEPPTAVPEPAATPDPTMLRTPQQNTAMTVTCGGQPYGMACRSESSPRR